MPPPRVQVESPSPVLVSPASPAISQGSLGLAPEEVLPTVLPPVAVSLPSESLGVGLPQAEDSARSGLPLKPHPPRKSVPPPAARPSTPSTRPPAGGLASLGELTSQPYAGTTGLNSPAVELGDRTTIAKQLVAGLSKDLTETKDKTRRARLHYEIAHLSEISLGDLEEASTHYRKAHHLEPGYEPNVAGLIRVRSLLGQWEATLPLYDEQVALSATPDDKAGLLFCKAVVLETRLEKYAEARLAYTQALKFAPGEASLLRAVARAARRENDFKALDQILAIQAEPGERDAKFSAAHAAERARVLELHPSKTIDPVQIYQQSFDIDPLASAAVIALERLYSASNQAREHVGVLRRRSEIVQNPASRASALAAAGALLAESLGQAAEAAQYFEQASKAQPENLSLLRQLEELYRKSGQFEEAVGVLQRLEERTKNKGERAGLCVQIAELLHRRLSRREQAVVYWERARDLSPAMSGSVEPLIAFYEEAEAWPQLVQVLKQEEAASQDIERRAAIHLRLAHLAERLSTSDAAIEHYRSALGLHPGDETASRQLSRLLEEASRYEELVEILQRAADSARDPAVAFVHLFKIGQVLEDLVKQPVRALPVYRRILDASPGHLGALFSIQRAAERAGEYEVLVDALIEEAGVVKGPESRVPLLHRAGEVSEKLLHQDQRAVKLYTEALTLNKAHAPTLDSFAAIHDRAGRYPELLKVLTLKLASVADVGARGLLLYRMGRLCEEHLRQDDAALEHHQKALECAPGSSEIALAIERCLARLGRHEELAELLKARISRVVVGPDRAEAAVAWGRVLEMRLGRLDEALSAYEMALSDVPDHEQALDARIRVLERMGEPQKTAQAHGQRALASTDSAVRLWARLRQAEILDATSRTPDAAIGAYESLLGEYPLHPAALDALCRLYEVKGDRQDLTRIVRLQATSMQDRKNQASAYRDLLRLTELSLDATSQVSDVSQSNSLPEVSAALLERHPGDRPALRFAELLAIKGHDGALLAQVDARYAQITSQSQLASAHKSRLGEYLEAKDPALALAQHRPALALDQENIGAARGMGRLAVQSQDPALLAEAAEFEARVALDPARAAELLSQSAQRLVAEGDTEAGLAQLHRALTLYPDSLVAAGTLHTLLTRAGRMDELLSALSTAAQGSRTVEAIVQHWIAVAKILADHKGDVPAAISALLRVEKSGAKSLDCHLELADLLLRDRQWKPAVDQLIKATNLGPDERMLVKLRLRLAEIYHEQLQKPVEATQQLSLVVETQTNNVEALRRLLAIQMKESAAGALKTAQTLAEAATGVERAEAFVAIGQLFVRANKPADAKKPFEAAISVLGLEPPDAADGLRSILVKEGGDSQSWVPYTRALTTFVGDSLPGEAQARAYLELGRTLADRQQAFDEAIFALTAGLTKNPKIDALKGELVQRLKSRGRYQEALPLVLSLTQSAPLEVARWSDLVDVYAAVGSNAEANLATGPLVYLGGGSELQRNAWASRVPQAAMLTEGAFDSEALAHTLDYRGAEEALSLFEQIAGPLSKVYVPELSQFGTSARSKVSARGNHPCRPALDRLCHSFGGLEVDLYPSDTAQSIQVVLTDPIGLVVPSSLMALTDVEQVFFMGRFVANIARRAAVVDALSVSDLRVTLAASMQLVDIPSQDAQVDSAELTLITRRLQKALPWLSKGRIEEAARRYGASPLGDVEIFARKLQLSAFHAALILCDDVGPLFKLSKGMAPLLGLQAGEADSLLPEILAYWATTESIALRRKIGLV